MGESRGCQTLITKLRMVKHRVQPRCHSGAFRKRDIRQQQVEECSCTSSCRAGQGCIYSISKEELQVASQDQSYKSKYVNWDNSIAFNIY
ncbi:hypothetical protein FGO68_gene1848 [Halteria grandinella]|uniref:Uncharacterized protein n=1 Tax=Halteria grandinella TaxID=5974 RepID=A0A8J8T5U4_HALGN|nr:hypothetical protein FGO68_gene1848 [Halteria grandinella]